LTPAQIAAFGKRGLCLSGDLLRIPPLRYQDRREYKPLSSAAEGEIIFFKGVVTEIRTTVTQSGRDCLIARIEDTSGRGATGRLWFFHGINHIARLIRAWGKYAVHGLVSSFKETRDGNFEPNIFHPEFWDITRADPESVLGVFPVYGTIRTLSPAQRKTLIEKLLRSCPGKLPRVLPDAFLRSEKIRDPSDFLRTIHEPPAVPGGVIPHPRQTHAFRTLGLHELMFWRLLNMRVRAKTLKIEVERKPIPPESDLGNAFVKALPFELTDEQKRVTGELKKAFSEPHPANILLQGEVGCGKTAVVATLLFRAAGTGRQGAIVAPTELLAKQHADFLAPRAKSLGIDMALLTGSTPAAEKKKILEGLENGTLPLLVSTQAAFSQKVVFGDLALAVLDEQHRFGVKQRLCLRERNPKLDLVSMSATPIPRSLASVLYGDMDVVSIMGTLPGRTVPDTRVFDSGEAAEAYGLFAKLVSSGEQGFLVSPRIGKGEEESPPAYDEEDKEKEREREEKNKSREAAPGASGEHDLSLPFAERGLAPSGKGPSIAEMEKKLLAAAPGVAYGIIHGKQNKKDRAAVMENFRNRSLRVLLSTTMVEVGVDVPGANVMLIEGAENMGLAQLHQLRGRVGRGGGKATLILLAHSEEPSDNARARFDALKSGKNGYELAELDLKLRGPGEDLGLKQSGWPKFDFVKLPGDLVRVAKAQAMAEKLFGMSDEYGPDLEEGLAKMEKDLSEEVLGV
jgi:ATP-dependent DNA helicase RecG